MPLSYLSSGPGIAKLATIIMGIAVVAIGLHAHFESAWVKHDFYKICSLHRIHNHFLNHPCPALALERFYVSAVSISLLVSLIGLILCLAIVNPYSKLFAVFDVAYHLIASVLILIAAIVFIVSAVQIENHPIILGDRSASWLSDPFRVDDLGIFLTVQKIIAGVITILLSFLYFTVVCLIRRGKPN